MIDVKGLTQRYGATRALDGLDLRIARGDMFGLIGPNGAGKTTLIRILATLLRPTAGSVTIAGIPLGKDTRALRGKIGYMPDSFGVYEDLTVHEYLEFFASAYELRGERLARVVRDVLELTDMGGRRDTQIGLLSRGMQQRLGLARVLVHDPEVLLLDEPASGLDPKARVEVRALLRELVRMGKTVLISSHILEDIADLCNRVGLIERGKLVVEGALRDVMCRIRRARNYRIQAAAFPEAALARLRAHPQVLEVAPSDGELSVSLAADCEDVGFLPLALIESGTVLRGIRELPPTLEEVFLSLTGGEPL